jgi:hypothetical protein
MLLHHRVREISWLRAALNATAASLVGVVAGWIAGGGAATTLLVPLAAVGLCFGLPAGLWSLARKRDARIAARVVVAWVATALPAALLVTPLF